MKRLKILCLLGVLWCVICIPAGIAVAQVAITASGGASEIIDAADLQTGAGSDLYSSYESATEAVSITISGTAGAGDTWRVDVKRVDTTWHGNLALSVKRTGDGTGGIVSDGETYLEITSTDQSFFTGSGDVSGITTQLKLSGMSIQVSSNTYTTTVWFTVVDT